MMSRPRGKKFLRGFTLIEMMAVVAVIAMMAAMATPSVLEILRDRHTQRDATDLMLTLQDARARAYGRGSSTRVVWNSAAASGRGLMTVNEALSDSDGDNIGDIPSPSCNACEQGDATGTCTNFWTPTQSFFQVQDKEWGTVVQLTEGVASTTATDITLCFTPQGRTYSFDGSTYVPLSKVLVFKIYKAQNGTIVDSSITPRMVLLGPNGVARMKL